VKISGYALTGGGRGVERVDVSVDGGKSWTEATRLQGSGSYVSDVDEQRQKWGWILWELHTALPLPTDIVAKAVCANLSLAF
jgi:sulfite oxidase